MFLSWFGLKVVELHQFSENIRTFYEIRVSKKYYFHAIWRVSRFETRTSQLVHSSVFQPYSWRDPLSMKHFFATPYPPLLETCILLFYKYQICTYRLNTQLSTYHRHKTHIFTSITSINASSCVNLQMSYNSHFLNKNIFLNFFFFFLFYWGFATPL